MAFERYGVDAVMVGRATFGRPWVFKEMNELVQGIDGTSTALTIDDKIDILKEQLEINVERSMNIVEFFTLDVILHRVRYSKVSQTLNKTRIAMLRANTVDELNSILEDCRVRLKSIESAE